ncbi:MAG: DUF6387 family protein [Proteobacteria bacterium]|nr:DUF6387 family protein [Pseudomonadota bacterium]
MRIKKIHSARDLPQWFSLESYKASEYFEAAEWACAIYHRLQDKDRHGKGKNEDGAHYWLYEKAHGPRWEVGFRHANYHKAVCEISRGFENIENDTNGVVTAFGPNIPHDDLSEHYQQRFGEIQKKHITSERDLLSSLNSTEISMVLHRPTLTGHPAVEFASRYSIFGAYFSSKHKEKIDYYFKKLKEKTYLDESIGFNIPLTAFDKNREEDLRNASNFLSKPYDETGFGLVEVDPSASDEQIIFEFKNWLAKWRKEMQSKTPSYNFTNEDFNKWHVYRLLAYFDLSYWAELEGVKIADAAMFDALFPNENAGGVNSFNDRIKRQKAWINKVFTYETARSLEAQSGKLIPLS